jgi:hypothetical protein
MNTAVYNALALKDKHRKTWRDKPESYWLARLVGEVGELAGALVGDHDDSPDWELQQIAAICLNWLEMRDKRLPSICARTRACSRGGHGDGSFAALGEQEE